MTLSTNRCLLCKFSKQCMPAKHDAGGLINYLLDKYTEVDFAYCL